MENISYDLIEKFREAGSGISAEAEILRTAADPAYLYALSPERSNLLEWYPWKKDMEVLLYGASYGAFCKTLSARVKALDIRDGHAENLEVIRFRYPELLAENGGNIGLTKRIVTKKYDAVVLPELTAELAEELLPSLFRGLSKTEREMPEVSAEQTAAKTSGESVSAGVLSKLLSEAASCLKEGGALLFFTDNSSALRYMTGADRVKGRVYAEPESVSEAVSELPFSAGRRYYPLPDGRLAHDIFSDGYLPKKGDFRGISDAYEAPRYLTCDEEAMYGKLCECGAFPAFAPGFLWVLAGYAGAQGGGAEAEGEDGVGRASAAAAVRTAGMSRKKTPLLPAQIYIRYNRKRIPAYQTKTEILEQNGVRRVVKTALSKEGNDHILSFEWKHKLLQKDRESRLLVQDPAFEKHDGIYSVSFAFLNGKTLAEALSGEITEGRAPLAKLKAAIELVLGVGAHACHNMDCLFENIMQAGEDYYYLDYEWVFEEALDRDYLAYRMLRYWYEAYRESLYAYPTTASFLAEFGIKEDVLSEFETMEASFQQFVHGDGQQLFSERFRQKTKGLSEIRETERKLAEFTDWNLRLQDEVREHKETISKNLEIERLSQNHIANIEAINRIHEADIAALTGELAYLRKHESLPSRICRAGNAALLKAFPKGSRKRKVLKYIKNTFRHPAASCRLFLTGDGRNRIAGDFKIGEAYLESGKLQLPDCLHYADLFGEGGAASGTEEKIRPKVSIVLPVYNQIAYTYLCVKSIIEHTDFDETPYEVILADDVSKDATAEIGTYIAGLSVSRNTENQGFLKNCNQAAKKALGSYIFFLNNDTQVKDGWLSALVRLMDGDPSIGMAGSKLIYPDGRLQEAGGIIWSDGSGWNYGRLDDPEKPQYNYVKEVDYISGAAIMIRKELWEEIGGFDERFAPAYCEDSDLAFEVRRRGKRVVYQPESVVVHYEGISNGTDVNGTGLKKYQLVNQEKFREKWKETLSEQSKNTGNPNPFAARERSQKKKCVLIIDHYVPTWDKDAGSKTTYQYIRMFLKKGWNVKFLGDNFLHEEPYTSALLQLGVEVLYGADMQRGIWDWIRENQNFIDAVYLNRPHIAVKYIEYLKKNTNLRCIFYGHDLHFMRLTREYELSGDIRIKREADYWKSIEFSVMRQADISYYPSETEVRAIHAIDPDIRVKAITAYLWDTFEKRGETDYEKREGLLFVGGFAHPPNEDGVLWFAETIFPKIREKLPDVNFYIAGSKVTEAVQKLGAEPEKTGIHVLGFVSDEELAALYRRTRITVVPLRYGAGVKGKVVEALYHGAVVVTTSVGAEGIPQADRVLAVVNREDEDIRSRAKETEEAFAEAVIRLYGDTGVLSAVSAETERYVREYYSLDAAWRVIAPDFEGTKKAETEVTDGRR